MKEVMQQFYDKVIPFWKSMHDPRGGFFGKYKLGMVDREAPKGAIQHLKLMTFFSRAYKVTKDASLKSEADHAYDFILNKMVDREFGEFFYTVRPDGIPLDKTKHVSATAIGLSAFSTYYEITKDRRALTMAYSCYNALEVRFRREIGYHEEFDRYFLKKTNTKYTDGQADRSLESMLLILQGMVAFSFIVNDDAVQKSLRYVYDLVTLKCYDQETKTMNIYMDEHLESEFDIVDYGLNMEASWVILTAGLALGAIGQNEMHMIRDLVDTALAEGYDGEAIAYRRYAKKVDESRVSGMQAECIIALINAYQVFKDELYLEYAKKLWGYMKNTLCPDTFWVYGIGPEGGVIDRPTVDEKTGPYHDTRMFLELLRRGVNVGL